jgi:S-adenosylmethionine decarboxylase
MVEAHDAQLSCPFEGPEKLLEIWFAPSAAHVPDATTAPAGRSGLRAVDRQIWEDMLDIVKCKVLSMVQGDEIDAYLLRSASAVRYRQGTVLTAFRSESSLFISPHRLILKTCGTTLNLLGLPRILDIARDHANMPVVHRLFYSRKSFMFPERQLGPHREWISEVRFLDDIFPNGSAYTVGRVNGDHWLLYMTGPVDACGAPESSPVMPYHKLPGTTITGADDGPGTDQAVPTPALQDYTIEILMTDLGDAAREAFYTPGHVEESHASAYARELSSTLGIAALFPAELTTLDAYSFTPCGYSSNALLKWGDKPAESGEGYYTIHVTPEKGWSYASFECNVPLPPAAAPAFVDSSEEADEAAVAAAARALPDLRTLIRRVVSIFAPGRITLTLFVSSAENEREEDTVGESAIEAAQRLFKAALATPIEGAEESDSKPAAYRRTDKINYEFGGYDLAFASFELRS